MVLCSLPISHKLSADCKLEGIVKGISKVCRKLDS